MGRQDLAVELYYGGAWHPAPAYVRDAVTITRGYRDEGGEAPASTADLTLDNRTGDYNPKNAASSLYGLVGRNTPIRAGLALVTETFGGTSSSGWTPADTGQTWTHAGAAAADFTESGGLGRHLHPTKNLVRLSYLDQSWLNVEQLSTFAIPAVALGASVVVGHLARYDPATNTYYWLRLEFNTGGSISAKISKTVAGTQTDLAVSANIPGLTYTAGQTWSLLSSVDGDRLSLRLWQGAVEPMVWTLTDTDTAITAPGRGGVASWAVGGNTNTSLVVSVDGYAAVDRRCVLEVASWKPGRTLDFDPVTGKGDAWTEVEAAGILRRLGQGADVLDSPLRRAILAADPTAYWPLEDADGALSAQSAVAGVDDMQPFGFSRFTAPGTGTPVAAAGLPKFGSGGGIPGSAPVVDLAQGGVLAGVVPAGSGGWRLEFVMVAPRDKAAARIPIRWTTDGTFPAWELQIESTGLFATFRTSVGAGSSGSATATFNVFDGRPHHYQIEAFQSGSNVDTRIYVDDLVVAVFGGTLAGTPGSIRAVTVNPLEEVNGTESMPTFGHLAAWNEPYSGLTTSAVAMLGHAGETAAARFLRLCAEEGVEAVVVGDAAGSRPVGAQRIAPFTELLAETARTDDGLLYEPRDFLGLVLRTGRDLQNQAVALQVNYAANEVKPPFAPVIDDKGTRNDVTAKSTTAGVTARDLLETGRMSVLPPPTGVGRYTTQLDVNPNDLGDVANLAGWARHKGTVDEIRFARLTVDLVDSPGLTAAAAAADVGDLAAVVNLPDDVTPDDASLLALGYVETIGSHTRKITFTAAPGSPYTVATVDGEPRVAADGSTLGAPLTSSALSLSLASTPENGPWTTAAADFPLDIRVGGERMTLSAITGTISPQPAAISARGVNGVQRAWPAGTEVDVWTPAIAPL